MMLESGPAPAQLNSSALPEEPKAHVEREETGSQRTAFSLSSSWLLHFLTSCSASAFAEVWEVIG